ncbi:unnamed protein product [Gongylonema pulchrum]|uniref:UNC80 domain-containing protein n=1 Tax=Gongylonema pulchrum TaxID=637853 RepID=A0A183ETD0_9BILA|nr:unnamed protein product [Gongylonema pulchrum]
MSAYGYGSALGNRGTPSATRRMHMMQRAAGRCFYHWGCQLGDRINKMIEVGGTLLEKSSVKKTELNRRELVIRDDLEDFFDEGFVSSFGLLHCLPIAVIPNHFEHSEINTE